MRARSFWIAPPVTKILVEAMSREYHPTNVAYMQEQEP